MKSIEFQTVDDWYEFMVIDDVSNKVVGYRQKIGDGPTELLKFLNGYIN